MQHINIATLLKSYSVLIYPTWALVLVETVLEVSIPLFIGLAIDGVMANNHDYLWLTMSLLALLIMVGVIRRGLDTRAYGKLKVIVCEKHRHEGKATEDVSVHNARLNMVRELVDFLEHHLPEVISAVVQVIVSVIILFHFSSILAISAVIAVVCICIVYRFFHGAFYRLNARLNEVQEQQVNTLREKHNLPRYLNVLKETEIKLSDKEAILYGLVFQILCLLLIFNLLQAAKLDNATAGSIFSIVVYTWEYIEAVIMLPITLQLLTRLREIENRLNSHQPENTEDNTQKCRDNNQTIGVDYAK